MTALSDLLADAKGDRSVDDLIVAAEKRLERQIHRTFRATIYKALDGDHAKSPREETLQLLADVFELDVRDLRTAVELPAGELGPYVPTSEASRLDRDQRRALDNLIKSIVKSGGGAHGAAAKNQPPDEGGGSVVQLPSRPPAAGPSGGKRAARKTRKPTARERGEDPGSPRPE